MGGLASAMSWFEDRMAERRRQKRIARASTMPVVDARIVHAAPALTKELKFEIQISFRFETAGEAAYGSAFSQPVESENYANMLVAHIAAEALLKVRYNPKDLFENFALTSDNPGSLPFELAD